MLTNFKITATSLAFLSLLVACDVNKEEKRTSTQGSITIESISSPSPTESLSPILPSPSIDANCIEADTKICQIEYEIFNLVNQARAREGKTTLRFDGKLSYVSRDWSKKQANNRDIGHSGFPGSRQNVYRNKFGSPIPFFKAENVAMNSAYNLNSSAIQVATALMNQWMNSSGHRMNIMSSSSRSIGVGVAFSRGVYGTQIFSDE